MMPTVTFMTVRHSSLVEISFSSCPECGGELDAPITVETTRSCLGTCGATWTFERVGPAA